MKKTIKSGACSGYLIGLSAYVYSACSNKIVGAFLFGLGLLTICRFKLNLFTGAVGESKIKDINKLYLIFFSNALGMVLAIILLKLAPYEIAAGIACGSLMQIGVSLYSLHPLATVACVAAFLLSNSNHCIAMLYNFDLRSIEYLWMLGCAIIGNIIGAKIISIGGIKRNLEGE